jgi:hypothetical protein
MDFLYQLFLTLHNLGRWLVVIFAVLALVRAYRGWFGGREWTRADDQAGMLFTIMVDTQVLLGLVLFFFFSSDAQAIFRNFSAAMANRTQAFFGLEHWFVMILAMGAAHTGRALARKAPTSAAKHKRVAIAFTLAVLLILAAIPWPFLKVGRPFFRLFGLYF